MNNITDKYHPTIGIECHVQLKTKSKLFSYADNDARDAEPNTKVTPICFGLPGVLPVLNEAAIEVAARAGKALHAKVSNYSQFDRKHYFYPDLPKGYQITQLNHPIVGEGYVDVQIDKENSIKVGIERAHLEEDAGKSTHQKGEPSKVDLNRAGTPLLEIVSKPDMHSAKEARAFAQELYFLMKYADVTDADLYHGNMRFDVNISIAPVGAGQLGTRAEIKNLNSFRSIEKAVDYEIKRQAEILNKGQEVVQETRGWDDNKMKTVPQRGKEDAHDYRYFPDPDLPPVEITDEFIEQAQADVRLVSVTTREKMLPLGYDVDQINTLLDNPNFVEVALSAIELDDSKLTKRVINWLLVDLQALIIAGMINSVPTIDQLKNLHSMLEDGKLNSSAAKEILEEIAKDSKLDPEAVAKDKNLLQENDQAALEELVDEIIKENPKAVEDIKNGEMKVMGYMVGQAMKKTGGKANPGMVTKLIKEKLS